MPDTIQTGLLQNTKDYSSFGYWINGIDVTQQNLNQLNPYTKGVARLFMFTPPYFMQSYYPDLTRQFKSYVETGITKMNGIQNLSVEFNDFEGGFAGQVFRTVKLVKDDTTSFSIALYEQSGSPVRQFIDTWVTGTRDPRSGVAHYHNSGISYGEKNHTAEFIYYVMDPTAQQIEYACMFACCFPTSVPKDHLNFDAGDRDNALIELEFNCVKYESRYINQVATWYMNADKITYNYIDFNPGIQAKDVTAAYSLNLK